MRRIAIAILLLASFAASAQNADTTKFFRSNDYGWRYERFYARKVFVLPSDTTVSKIGLVQKGTTLYVGNGSYFTAMGGSSGLTIGSTSVTGGTSGRLLYNNAGVLGEYSSLSASLGGTGNTSYTIGDILYASSSSALSKLAGVATGNALISGGVGTAPSWGKVGLTTHVSGTLPVANGGTGNTSTATSGYIPVGDGTKYVPTAPGSVTGLPYWKLTGTSTLTGNTMISGVSYDIQINSSASTLKISGGTGAWSIGDNIEGDNFSSIQGSPGNEEISYYASSGGHKFYYSGAVSPLMHIDGANNKVTVNGELQAAKHFVDNIDVTGGDYSITLPGVYRVTVIDGSNRVQFPNPASWSGHSITVIISGSGGGDQRASGTYATTDANANAFGYYKDGYSYTFFSTGSAWICTARYDATID